MEALETAIDGVMNARIDLMKVAATQCKTATWVLDIMQAGALRLNMPDLVQDEGAFLLDPGIANNNKKKTKTNCLMYATPMPQKILKRKKKLKTLLIVYKHYCF